MKQTFFYVSAVVLFAACGDATTTKDTTAPEVGAPKGPVCTYSYNAGTTQMQWEAYKFTEKKGVKGTFTDVKVSGVQDATEPARVFEHATFDITTGSVSSGDATRDPKITEHFFGKMTSGEHLTGSVTSVEGTETSGTIVFNLSMNGTEKAVEGTYTVTGNELELTAALSVSDWGGDAAIASLNEACKDLHKGPDGSSKLWPDVTVSISTTLNKACK